MKKLLILLLIIPFISYSQNNKLYKVQLISHSTDEVKTNTTDKNSLNQDVNNFFKFILLENTMYFKKGEIIQINLNCPKEKQREVALEKLEFFISIGDEKENKLNRNSGWFVFYKKKNKDIINLWCGYTNA